MKILLSESQEIFRTGIAKILNDLNFFVEIADDLISFKKKLDNSFDIIIFDVEMLGDYAFNIANEMQCNPFRETLLIATFYDIKNNKIPNLFEKNVHKPFNKNKLLNILH
jgi:DNA-binding response OmpR family regulator